MSSTGKEINRYPHFTYGETEAPRSEVHEPVFSQMHWPSWVCCQLSWLLLLAQAVFPSHRHTEAATVA